MQSIRNICIIAHVDHGKTTLVDAMLRQSGTFDKPEKQRERVMDSMDQEQERGITIQAKNASITWKDVKINIIDTPGHADFGGEVERIISMADGALLLVDGAEGPLPQTRFVLQKAIRQGLKIILVINKVDRPECADHDQIHRVIDQTFDLFLDLGASDAQADFPILYACARKGWASLNIDEVPDLIAEKTKGTLDPLFDQILTKISEPKIEDSTLMRTLVSNLSYSSYVGRLAIGRIRSGRIFRGQKLFRFGVNAQGQPMVIPFAVTRLYTFKGMEPIETEALEAGDIGQIAGMEEVEIGDSLLESETDTPFPRIDIEKPTVAMIFSTNTSPFSGKEGKAIQPRELRERLIRETKSNVALRFEEGASPDQCKVFGRGELQFAILIEQMRRENYEFMVGCPQVIYQTSPTGERLEPYEKVTIDLPEDFASEITGILAERKGILTKYEPHFHGTSKRVRLEIEIPTRGFLGMRSHLLTASKGEALVSSETLGYRPHKGEILKRKQGALVSDRTGVTTEYALLALEDRGVLFVEPGIDVYEGMIVGENAKETDLNINVCREKKLTNVRAAHAEILVTLRGIHKVTLEFAIEWLDDDEWIEVTPKSVRVRKKVLPHNLRGIRRSDRID